MTSQTPNADETELSDEETLGLIPDIRLRSELNAFEEANIRAARLTALGNGRMRRDLTTFSGLLRLHRMMFDDVWIWAGTLRMSEKNLGIPKEQVHEAIKVLLDDFTFWAQHRTYPLDERLARLHHRLTQIHPFPNGNGRHARLLVDLLRYFDTGRFFTWGMDSGASIEIIRREYIHALRSADQGDLRKLLRFMTT